MQRTYQTQAIVLNIHPAGENNSTVTLLTSDKGIIYGTLYGGPKSKLKSLLSLWNSGIIYLYDNPERNQTKICDFDVKNYHVSFSENLFKFYAASLAAEIAIKTHCGGSNEECFKLVAGFLDGMELSKEEESRIGLVRFLWRYLELLGVQPDATCCSHCEASFLTSEFALTSQCHYNERDNDFICEDCSSGSSENTPLQFMSVRYLAGISLLKPAEARLLQISKSSFEELRNFVFWLLQKTIEVKLNTLETGLGIL